MGTEKAMPSSFDRFRYLNGSVRNDTDKMVYVTHDPEQPKIEVPPGADVPAPMNEEGEFFLLIPKDEPEPPQS
jgi:hypothetical protein